MNRTRRRAFKDPSAPPISGAFTGDFLSLGCRLAEFKSLPTIPVLTSHRPLFPGACKRCSPLSVGYLIDPVTPILAVKNLLRGGGDVYTAVKHGGSWAHYILLKIVRHVFSAGVLVSPGQVEILRAASKRGLPLLILPRYSRVWDHIVFLLVLWVHGLPSPTVQWCREAGPVSRGVRWWLDRLGIVRGDGIVELLANGRSVQSWVEISVLKQQLGGLLPLGQEGGVEDVLVVPAVASYEIERGRGWWVGGGRIRVDFDQPVSLKEMFGSKGWGEEELVQHVEHSRSKLGRVTAAQIVAFVLGTGLCKDSGVFELERAVQEIRDVLREKGVDVAFQGDEEDVVKWGVKMLGGVVRKGEVELDCDKIDLWREGRFVEQHFVPEAVVGVVAMGLVGQRINCSREGNKENSITISQEKLMEKGELLLRLLGEDKRQVPPCAEISGVMLEGLARVERREGLGRIEGPSESQHGEGKWTRRVARQVDLEGDWQEEQGRYVDTHLVVGVSRAGREWLEWVAGLLRNRVRNLLYTSQVLHMVREKGVVKMEEVVLAVKLEVEGRKGKMWDVGMTTGEKDLTVRSVEVLSSAGVVMIVKEGRVDWLSVAKEFDTREMVEKVIKVVMEFRC